MMHKLLHRQLKRAGLAELLAAHPRFLESISDAYTQHEDEIRFIEHSLFVVSNELNEQNTLLSRQVDELSQANTQISRSGAELTAILDATGEAIISFDSNGELSLLNRQGKDFINQLQADMIFEEQLLLICKNPTELEETFEAIRKDPFINVNGVIEFKRRRYYEFYSSPKVVDGQLQGRVWSFKDITSQKITDDIIRFQALHDTMTGLPNRNCLNQLLEKQLRFHSFHLMKLAVLFIDLSGLKKINDTQGFEVGDAILIDSVHRIMLRLRDQDIVARFGGDDLIAILRDISGSDEVMSICQNIERDISQPIEFGNHLYFISCHIGVSIYPEDGETVNDLVRHADLAKYHGFNHGSAIQFFSFSIAEEEVRKQTVENQLRKAIENLELTLYLQPKVDIKTGAIKGSEGLIRWIKPDGGVIPPGVFIPIAENTGMIRDIGRLVVHEACKILAHWSSQGITDTTISVNLSIADFNDVALVNDIMGELERFNVSPSRLILEVTESLFMANKDLVRNAMLQLESQGVRFALDDFGTGYSSLSYLQELPFSYLKIDRSFLLGALQDAKKAAIVQTIIDIGKNLNLELVAEGIEDAETLEFVRGKTDNCALVQGFFFYRPMPHADLTELLLKHVL
ncbi:EAL domain-containing protein [Hahella sp. CR1]|uniref:putative bifunctional diguanylate cyclase/phosphodiesterase n=1 Tax=Hahella sp. CR1 TaxID=2992807 RepID=UPI002442BB91|nr:GGDEF domain-containing phosphodiesterase [Hahella sp. CR1]MDG9672041.1 EAL domain-containing protein [Hahella sp. CR1]